MNNIIECKLESTYKEIFTGLWQYDYGQKLRITGGNFPEAVEIQFSLNKKSGSVITRIGTTTDGVTEVKIPDELLKNEGQSQNYSIYAYIYLTDETSGSTEYEIVLHVKSRTKPENPSEEPLPEPNIFHETVVAVNASAERAETAEKNAKDSAEKAETTLVDMKETVGNLTETVEQAEKLDGNLDKKLEQGENIVANIKDKLDAPKNPMVGKYLRVKAVNEDGVPELEWVDEPSGGSSLDIQINGQSIVKDGIAEIPLCTKTKGPGLIAIDTYSNSGGLYRANNDTGLIRIAKASDNNLAERKNEFCPVVPKNLDYAVKSAMCDGKGAAWTAEEQAAARERMGLYGKWQLKSSFALESPVAYIDILDNLESNEVYIEGSDFLLCNADGTPISGSSGMSFAVNDTNMPPIMLGNMFGTQYKTNFYAYIKRIKNVILIAVIYGNTSVWQSSGNILSTVRTLRGDRRTDDTGKIYRVRIANPQYNTYRIQSGATVNVYTR